ncbi:MAG: T9SS type A sorting domain-containing protein [Bacteroidota bacterium]
MLTHLKRILLATIIISARFSISAQPTGIYALDNNQGTFRDANIRNYSFVEGFVWRTSWAEFETSPGVYTYAGIDHIVQRLDSIHKKLTILFGAYSVEPSYIASQSGVTTYQYTDPISNVTTTRAVPYDGYLLQRFRLFLSSLANHQLFSLSSGTMVALKNHPVLANIATNIPGLGAIRNVNGSNVSLQSVLPDYTRSKFVDSLSVSMKIQTDNFPTKNVFIPSYKNVNDDINSPSLADFVKSQLLATFDGIQNPKISFWQENLAGFTDTSTNLFTGLPTTTFATPLLGLGNSAYTMFQMLQGWTTPFLDPTKTAHSTPFDAMCYAYKTYGASYYEVYVSDLDNINYQQSFADWDTTNCNTLLSVEEPTDTSKLTIYPNPTSRYISIAGIKDLQQSTVYILNVYGEHLLTSNNPLNIDISSLSNGVYLIKIEQNTKVHLLKFVKGH